jgi:pyruvate/2-oxoglutarate dehydrogenase complex dihydrolipoamide acyltransferase (E2) component
MFRLRVIPVAVVLVAGLSLSACSGTSGSFDPTDWISGEWISPKPRLPGDRKAVFPDGVPGVPEGVPKELVKGNQQAAAEAAELPPEPAPAAKPAPKPQAKPAPRPRTASAPQQRQPASQADSSWPSPQQQQQPGNRAQTSSGQAANSNSGPSSTQTDWPTPQANTSSR